MEMFEQATRTRIRFDSPKGLLSVEDLWDLSLTSSRANTANLNDIAKSLNREIKAAVEEDFVQPATKTSTELQLKFDVVKHIIAARMAENEAARTVAEKKARKERLLELIAQKQDEQLKGASIEDLTAMVNSL